MDEERRIIIVENRGGEQLCGGDEGNERDSGPVRTKVVAAEHVGGKGQQVDDEAVQLHTGRVRSAAPGSERKRALTFQTGRLPSFSWAPWCS